MEGVVEQGDAVGNEANFGGEAGGFAKAAVVDCEEVRVGLRDHGAVGVGSPALGDVAGVAVDWDRGISSAFGRGEGVGTVDDDFCIGVIL